MGFHTCIALTEKIQHYFPTCPSFIQNSQISILLSDWLLKFPHGTEKV